MLRRFSLIFLSALIALLCLSSCKGSTFVIKLEDLPNNMQTSYLKKMQEKFSEDPSNRSYALYDVNQDGSVELFVGWARKFNVYQYKDGTLLHMGEIYNEPFAAPNVSGLYTYGGFGTGVGGSAFFAIQDDVLEKAEGNTDLQYLISQGESTFLVNGKRVSEEIYNQTVDQYFNNQTRIPIYDIPQ